MRIKFVLIISIIALLTLTACGKISDSSIPQNEPTEPSGTVQIEVATDSEAIPDSAISDEAMQNESGENSVTNISITVGSSVFTAKLHDNKTARDFAARLPLTLNMSELNGNEKFYNLSDRLPTDSERIGNINSGDLMLYGSDCLVLFYKCFSSSYSYTKLGYIEDTSGLADALGRGSVEVTFVVND